MRKIKEYHDSDIAIQDFKILSQMVEENPEMLASLLMHLRNILIARGLTPLILSQEIGFNVEKIEKALSPANKSPDENILVKVMRVAGFDLKNWQTNKRTLEKITTKYDEVLRRLSKT